MHLLRTLQLSKVQPSFNIIKLLLSGLEKDLNIKFGNTLAVNRGHELGLGKLLTQRGYLNLMNSKNFFET